MIDEWFNIIYVKYTEIYIKLNMNRLRFNFLIKVEICYLNNNNKKHVKIN